MSLACCLLPVYWDTAWGNSGLAGIGEGVGEYRLPFSHRFPLSSRLRLLPHVPFLKPSHCLGRFVVPVALAGTNAR